MKNLFLVAEIAKMATIMPPLGMQIDHDPVGINTELNSLHTDGFSRKGTAWQQCYPVE